MVCIDMVVSDYVAMPCSGPPMLAFASSLSLQPYSPSKMCQGLDGLNTIYFNERVSTYLATFPKNKGFFAERPSGDLPSETSPFVDLSV